MDDEKASSLIDSYGFYDACRVCGTGGDSNRDSLRQAWAAIQAQQKKESAAAKELAETSEVALASPKVKSPR